MGMPQFMPDSFRVYAVDFDGDGRRDIWDNTDDVIGSVANYFVRKGDWQRGQPVTFQAQGVGPAHQALVEAGTKPSLRFGDLVGAGISVDAALERDTRVSLVELDTHSGPEHWVALDNFYAIMRYNPRAKYAMAVYQLSEAIREQYQAALAGTGAG